MATKVDGLTALHHLVSVATGAEINWQREALTTILLRALVFWEEDALCLSVPAAVRALTAIHGLHGGASSASGAAALAACERLAAELIRALGMVESDKQRGIVLAGLRELIESTHLLMAQFLQVRLWLWTSLSTSSRVHLTSKPCRGFSRLSLRSWVALSDPRRCRSRWRTRG